MPRRWNVAAGVKYENGHTHTFLFDTERNLLKPAFYSLLKTFQHTYKSRCTIARTALVREHLLLLVILKPRDYRIRRIVSRPRM